MRPKVQAEHAGLRAFHLFDRRQALLAAVLLLLPAAVSTSSASDRQFLSGYAGTLPSRESDRAGTYFNQPAVRAILARLESKDLTPAECDTLLAHGATSIEDLLRVGILRRRGDRLALGFAYFTAADMETIHAVADRAASDLAAAYRARHGEFENILRAYSGHYVAQGELAFVLLAGFSLNWDGLDLTQKMGLRGPRLLEGKDFRYSFWASEAVAARDYREFYWGSSSFPARDSSDLQAFTFSSFGDPGSDPRMNFPDLAYLPAGDMTPAVRAAAERVGLHDAEEMGQRFQGVLGGTVLRATARVLFALRKGPAPASKLRSITVVDPVPLLGLLQTIGYVEQDHRGLYWLRVPVLDESDRPMFERALAMSRGVMRSWLEAHGSALRRQLSGLTAVRAGLSFEEIFTQVWHEIFGATTRELARDGVIASAYRSEARSKGSYSVLWRQSLYVFVPG